MSEAAERCADVLEALPLLGSLMDIKTKSEGVVRFSYDRWHPEQRRFEEDRTGRDIVLKGRQIGFTTLEDARDVQYARTHSGVQVLIISHDDKTKHAIFDALHVMVSGLVKIGLVPAPMRSNTTEIAWEDNRSVIRIVEAGATDAVAQKVGRSGTIQRLHCTEMAFWRQAQTTMNAALNALTPDGEVVIESTPNGAAGLFFELCDTAMRGEGDYRFHFFSWLEHPEYSAGVPVGFDPRIRTGADGKPDRWETKLRQLGATDGQVQFWRERVDNPAHGGPEAVAQEFPIDPQTCFRSPGGSYIPAEHCDWLATLVRDPIDVSPVEIVRPGFGKRALGMLNVYERSMAGTVYVASADVAEGIGNDASAIDVSEWATGRTVATYWSDSISPGDFGLALAAISVTYGRALAAPERNNHGAAVLTAMLEIASSVTPYDRIWCAADGRPGWVTSTATRPVMFDESLMGITEHAWFTPDARTVSECKTLVREGGKVAARGKGTKGGARDDAFIAKAIGWQVRQRMGMEIPKRPPGWTPAEKPWIGKTPPGLDHDGRTTRAATNGGRKRWE